MTFYIDLRLRVIQQTALIHYFPLKFIQKLVFPIVR